MSHEHVLERLDDWVGDELAPGERAEVDLHLAGCAECRAEAEGLRSLLAEIGALPHEILPANELWTGIAARLEPRGSAAALPATGPRRLRVPGWMMQAAAVVLLMAGSSVVTYWAMPEKIVQQLPVVGDDSNPAVSALVAFRPAEQEYRSAIGELEMVLQTQRSRLAPETVQTLEANLTIIDEAIAQSRAALARDPNSAEVARMLSQAYDQKLNVLRQAVSL
jgi:anti-sigma factor RsiW